MNAETSKHRKLARLTGGYWPYKAPFGCKYQNIKPHGNLLVRVEPIASIIQEAMKGIGSGRFASKSEVARFLKLHPEFPYRSKDGDIPTQRVSELFSRPVYAGYVCCDKLGIPLTEAKHEPLVPWSTFETIKE